MLRVLFILMVMLLPVTVSADKSASKIKQEQNDAKRAIKENQRKLQTNKREINKQLKQLNSLEREINARDAEISRMETDLADIDSGIATTAGEIDSLVNELSRLQTAYTGVLRKFQSVPVASSPLAYLFSANSMNDVFAKLRQLKEFNKWRMQREKAITATADELGVKKTQLKQLQQAQQQQITNLNRNKAILCAKQSQTDKLVVKLRAEGGQMQAEIDRRQKQLKKLDQELNRIIDADRKARAAKAAKQQKSQQKTQQKSQQKTQQKTQSKTPAKSSNQEQAKETKAPKPTGIEQTADEDRVLTGSFESNKGRLLFPVSGRYKVVRNFGRGSYSSKVQTSHIGIDIEVPKGAQARAVFQGVVTNVSNLDGFNNIVVVRHGSYLTIYVNLASVRVSAGQSVVKGQIIGTVAADEDGANGLLQFGLRKERIELNPLQWVK